MSTGNENKTKVKCSVRFEVTTTQIMQLDDIEFYLDAHDEEKVSVIDNDLIKSYVRQMCVDDKIFPCDGDEYTTEECFMADDDIREVVSFEVIKPLTEEKFIDPNQFNLI